MSAQDTPTKMLVIGHDGRSSRLVADKLLALRHGVAKSRPRKAIAQLESESWRGTVDTGLLREVARQPCEGSLT
jgi:hypothetical protein